MTIGEYITDVRRCIDEEAQNPSYMSGAVSDCVMMDHMIRSRTRDALLFAACYAPLELLSGSAGMVKDYTQQTAGLTVRQIPERGCTSISLPNDFIRLSRVRCEGWHRAVQEPLTEGSPEALALMDVTGVATVDRPQAVLVNSGVQKLELYPQCSKFELSIVCAPYDLALKALSGTVDEDLNIPFKIRPAVTYYTAFLVLSAYRDAGAKAMLDIARLSMGADKRAQ